MSLALSTLLYEWRRYMAAIIALALSGVLMLALTSLFVGVLASFTVTIDRSRSELLILPAKASSLGMGGGGALPRRVLPQLYRHPEVVEVRDLPGDRGQFYGPGAVEAAFANTIIIDTTPNAVTLPNDITEEQAKILSVPFNIAVDRSALGQLKVKLGDLATLNGRTVRVALILENYPNSQMPNVMISRQTQRLMGRANDNSFGLLMVRIKDPKRAEQVRDELNAMANDQYRAWTKDELAATTTKEMMSSGFLAMIVGFMSVIGFVIGVAITWQTLRGAILANIKEFASLRALGVAIGDLRWVVMELSLWVGVLGVAMSAIAMGGIMLAAKAANIPMGFEPASMTQTAILLLLIAIGSGALTLGALKKGEPADLLK